MTALALPLGRALRAHYKDFALYALLLGVVAWFIASGEQGLGYHWKWYRMPRYLFTSEGGVLSAGPLLQGLFVTFQIAGISMVLAMAFGLTTAILRQSSSFAAQMVARGYVEFIRNTPLLTQIFFIYYVIAPVLGMDGFASAVLALSLFEGAYASEIFRSGIVSIQEGQWEAAYSLGLSRFDTYRTIIVPQAVRRVLPPLTGVAVSLIKDSSLASTIAIFELTQHGNVISSDTFMVFEVWFTVAAIYLSITLPLSLAVAAMEKRLKVDE
ncbi:amino acid ABC transporter permease [Desulfovibrio ferrophilus]|uniref:Polar amino acid ABC transporter inner membrane subunit n=1 Tax=Desulfovibrio ferrophilus TaxID=241368 RepID=A0A2Z6B0F0_9BACT|nr:amino acid ABC transporter permease [Desulfovibrio ferrophilus]BBD08925.1 polar amino acid ABC transporter inner membrane subunit [Desulfovibrio ferrophilus]